MVQLEHIEAIEKRLWGAVEMLGVNSNYARSAILLIPLQVLQEQFNVSMTSVLSKRSIRCAIIYVSMVVFMSTIRASMLLEAI